jgi:hypothetical protein
LEPSKETTVTPSCGTCLHQPKGGLNEVPTKCWDCTSFKTLIHWEPKPKETETTFAPLEYAALHGTDKVTSDGSTASYYELPVGAEELQDLIGHRNMNAQIGEIFRECYRYGQASHCDELRGIKKIIFYATAEKERLEKLAK